MPISYHRDDARQLITVTVTEPHTLNEVLGVIDRQAREGTWHYALLYDLTASHMETEDDARQVRDHALAVGGGLTRGPVALAIAPNPEDFRLGLHYSALTGRRAAIEVLLTPQQMEAWLVRWDTTTKSGTR